MVLAVIVVAGGAWLMLVPKGGVTSLNSSNNGTSPSNNAVMSTNTNLVRFAVVRPESIDRIKALLSAASIEVAFVEIKVPEGGFNEFPPGSFGVLIHEADRRQVRSIVIANWEKNKYWFQAR